MTERRIYTVTVSHPTNYHQGEHKLTVTTNYNGKSVYISGDSFGCSRDYAMKDNDAIYTFMREHGCSVLACKKAKA